MEFWKRAITKAGSQARGQLLITLINLDAEKDISNC